MRFFPGSTSLLELKLPRIVELGNRPRIQKGSPWDTVSPIFNPGNKSTVTVGLWRYEPFDVVVVKNFPFVRGRKAVYMFTQVEGRNFVRVIDILEENRSIHIIFEYVSISLQQVVESNIYPKAPEVSSILRQVRKRLLQKKSVAKQDRLSKGLKIFKVRDWSIPRWHARAYLSVMMA